MSELSSEMQAFETHMDRMERVAEENRGKLAVAKQETKQARWEAIGWGMAWLFGSMAVVAIVLGITYAIYKGTEGPSSQQKLDQDARMTCIKGHGTWLGTGSDNTSVAGSCVMPGSSTE